MSQFFTDKYLKYRAALRGLPIEKDKPCDFCAYNLRGLRFGGRCPECGTPITYRRARELVFHEMPLPLIRRFRLSAWMATIAVAGWLVLPIALLVFGGDPTYLALGVVLAALWFVASWRLTAPVEVPMAAALGFGPISRLRLIARWFQLGWIVAILILAVGLGAAAPGGGMPRLYEILLWLSLIFAVIGVGALALLLGRFAEWVGSEFAAHAFDLAVLGALVALALGILIVPLMSIGIATLIFVLLLGGVLLLTAASIVAFPVGLIALAHSLAWSIVHARERVARDEDLQDRMAPAPPAIPEPEEPIRLSENPGEAGPS